MTEDQTLGAIVRLAVGDALGTTTEFSRNPSSDRSTWHTEITGGGPFGLKPAGWTDDTSMALARMQAYLDKGECIPEAIGQISESDWTERFKNGKLEPAIHQRIRIRLRCFRFYLVHCISCVTN